MKKDNKRKIVLLVMNVVVITAVLVALSYNFFLNADYRINETIKDATSINATNFSDFDLSTNRKYCLVYDQEDELSLYLKANIERTLNVIKVNFEVVEINNVDGINKDDYIITTFRNWIDNTKAINIILDAVENGASLLIANIPYDDEFLLKNKNDFGIAEFGESKVVESFVVKGDIILGLKKGDTITASAIEEYSFDIKILPSAELYLESENGVPLYFTSRYGLGKIGLFNGENLTERYLDGMIIGMLGTLEGDFVYPIVNTGVMFIDDWPGPIGGEYATIQEQYGMSLDEFIQYVWWPDMVALGKQYNIHYVGQYVLTYNNVIEPTYDVDDADFNISMYAYGQQLIKYGGEIGMHGYNHQPLRFSEYPVGEDHGYKIWTDKDNAVEALTLAIEEFKESFPDYDFHCYVPPSNIIDETGVEVIKEVLGTPSIISGVYVGDSESTPSFGVKYKDEVVYLPRFSAGSFLDDDQLLSISMGASTYGVISHFIHPDDVIDPERSKGLTWDEMRLEYSKLMEFVEERYPFIEYSPVTEGANKIIDWQLNDLMIDYKENEIQIKCSVEIDKVSLILKTDKKIVKSDDYEFIELGELSYYVSFEGDEVNILLEEEN